MSKYEGNFDFQDMSPDGFRDFLRGLQKDPYRWPNLYLAWEKQDGSLLMVGVYSTQMYHLIKHEIVKDSVQNVARAAYGKEPEYSSVLYGISPGVTYLKDGVRYDPVEKLVAEVGACKYIGSWKDPDVFMYDASGVNRTIACGRFALAKEKIGIGEGLDEVIASAKAKAGTSKEAGKDFEISK